MKNVKLDFAFEYKAPASYTRCHGNLLSKIDDRL